MQNKPYELIEHTADIGLRVKADSLGNLFLQAATALFDIIAEKKKFGFLPPKKIKINLQADNREELFIDWLNELLSLASAKELIFSKFKITKISDQGLEAVAFGRNAGNYKVNVEVKAATYHDLRIKEIHGVWQAEVILDV